VYIVRVRTTLHHITEERNLYMIIVYFTHSEPKGTVRLYYRRLKRFILSINPLTPNDPYMGRTAPLTSKRCISYIYSTNIDTECFKYAVYSPIFSLQNAVCFIMLTCLVPSLLTFYIQNVLKLKKKIIPAPNG